MDTGIQLLVDSFELSQDFLLVMDQEGNILHANAVFLKESGYTQREYPLQPTRYLHTNQKIYWSEVQKGSGSPKVYEFLGAKGQSIKACWSSVFSENQIIAVGNPTQDALNPQTLVDSYEQMAVLLDEYGNMEAFNAEAERALHKVSRRHLTQGSPLLPYVPKSEQRAYAGLIRSGLRGEKKIITRKLSFEKGLRRWLEITIGPIKNKQGEVEQVLLTLLDITKRKEAEERFQELEISYRSIFRQLAAGILLYDLDLTLIQANQGFSDLLGYTPEDLEVTDTFSYTYPDDQPKSSEMAHKLINGELDHYSLEKRYIHKNGQIIWCMLTATLVYDLSGRPKHVISVIQNIDKQKRTEEDLRFKKNELDAFVHRASHDLKGPVNSLMALYQVVEAELAGESKAMEYFGHYDKNIRRLHDIIQNLLELSRIKDIKAHFKPVDISHIVDEAEDMLRHLPNYENITFHHNYELPATVKSDHTLLSTIIQNLIENAIKYSNPMLPGEVQVHIKHKDGLLTIKVEDNGIGIQEEVLPKIFNMFYRATTQATGSGLGLYLLKNAVDKLEGTIDIDSKYGQGTTFTIFLPTEGSKQVTEAITV